MKPSSPHRYGDMVKGFLGRSEERRGEGREGSRVFPQQPTLKVSFLLLQPSAAF